MIFAFSIFLTMVLSASYLINEYVLTYNIVEKDPIHSVLKSKKTDSLITAYKDSIYLYCKSEDQNPTVENIPYLDSLNTEGNPYRISFDSTNEIATISSDFTDQNYENFEKQLTGVTCVDGTCSFSFRIDEEETTPYNSKSKCSYQQRDFDMDDFLKNTCETNVAQNYTYLNGNIEDSLHVTSINCSDTNDINDTTISNLDFTILREPIISIDINNKSISDLTFLLDMNISSSADLNLSYNSIEDISPLANLSFNSVDLSGNTITTTSTFLSKNVDLTDTGITDLSFLQDNSVLENLNLTNLSVSDLSVLSDKTMKIVNLTGTDVDDLTDIGSSPLTELYLKSSLVQDLTPICDNTTLTVFESNAVDTKCAVDSNFCSLDIINNNSDYCE